MSDLRRRILLIVRSLTVICVLVCLASPARTISSKAQSVVFLLDHSKSLGKKGISQVYEAVDALKA
ncbi:MAG: hypothetical protein AAF226_08880, partial [Verrucomicrobiota bacterium]